MVIGVDTGVATVEELPVVVDTQMEAEVEPEKEMKISISQDSDVTLSPC